MGKYVLQRTLLFIPTLFFITLLSFGISRLAPGDPAALKVGVTAEGGIAGRTGLNERTLELLRKQWHLDKPIWQQYLLWLRDLIRLDFGRSFQDNRPVLEKVVERLPITLAMNVMAVLLAYGIAIPLGIFSAKRSGSFADRLVAFLLFALYSLPTFWVGMLAMTFLCNPEYLALFPTGGIRSLFHSEQWSLGRRLLDYAWHLTLPMMVYTYSSFAFISRQMRSAMLEVLRQDYIRTAYAKGLPGRVVIWRHALRNSLIPIVTLLAGVLPALVGGSVIVETIFSIPGMGELSFRALVARDYPVIMALFTFSALLTLVGILLSDILYAVIDPRISFARRVQ
ncbi:MAG: ABC transporter permease [Candidatus Kapabacteria bacterium]|nr:ABC transporter permease [Candidatus Kapabacteria bacterium]MCS7169416.1 ABC transporter permease [Candidatus Kapabacteria bacterium]MDW7996750.1 ABC transporter permease [Bacteroidota bacterium]MDW8225135.1 ABC transporter permease [Bacteroidota bacterium]